MSNVCTFNYAAAILPVSDVEAAVVRYTALGFKGRVYRREEDQVAIYGFLERSGVHFHLALTTDLDPHRTTSAVYLYVDDPDALFQEWSGVSFDGCVEPPEDRDWGMREMTYVDPDGNLLRIGRPLT